MADPFRLAFVLAVNLAIVAGLVGTGVILRNHKPPPKPATKEAAFQALDAGQTNEARRLAERLAAKRDLSNEEWGIPDYILGVLCVQDAEAAGGADRTEAFRLAALYLQRSRERGFPAHRETTGLYLLGKSLCLCGRLDEALPVLQEAIHVPAEHEAELRTLLIESLIGACPPRLDEALAENRKLVANSRLTDDARREALLRQAQILLRLDRTQECADVWTSSPTIPCCAAASRCFAAGLPWPRAKPSRNRRGVEKGTVAICRNGPEGPSHKWGLSPFPRPMPRRNSARPSSGSARRPPRTRAMNAPPGRRAT